MFCSVCREYLEDWKTSLRSTAGWWSSQGIRALECVREEGRGSSNVCQLPHQVVAEPPFEDASLHPGQLPVNTWQGHFLLSALFWFVCLLRGKGGHWEAEKIRSIWLMSSGETSVSCLNQQICNFESRARWNEATILGELRQNGIQQHPQGYLGALPFFLPLHLLCCSEWVLLQTLEMVVTSATVMYTGLSSLPVCGRRRCASPASQEERTILWWSWWLGQQDLLALTSPLLWKNVVMVLWV